ncbi:MAG: hypothetical protein AB7P04_00675 [Bacteriovoracia bacterium]
MKKVSSSIIAVAVAMQWVAGAAFAAETSTATKSSIWSKFSGGYSGAFYGPSLGNFSSPYQPDAEGNSNEKTGKLLLENSVSINYQIDSKVKVYVNPRFNFFPVKGGDFVIKNTRMGIKMANAIERGNFKLSSINFTLEVPTSKLSLDKGLIVAPGSFSIVTYKLGENSRWTLGSYNDFRFYFWSAAPDSEYLGNTRSFAGLLSPFLSYSVSDQFGVEFRMAASTQYNRGEGFSELDPKNLALALNIDVIPKWTLVPTLTVFPWNTVTWDSMQVGLEIYGSLF